MIRGFWETLQKPIIGLSPMDGVTDAAARFIADKYGKPDILFTEFTSVEGICYGAHQLLQAFIHHKTTTPTVAQIFGATPEAFYKVAFILGEMGFDGIDINMGCPDPHVAKKGGGAALILRPKLAQEIVRQTRKGIQDWANGSSILDIELKDSVINFVKNFQEKFDIHPQRKDLPVSVKTRIGYDEIVTEQWIKQLLEVEPVNISLHGRTLKQLYSGLANWEEIGKAAALVKKTNTTILGNGDVKNLDEAKEKIKTCNLDGVLIGRASFGNPWIFQKKIATLDERFAVALKHCRVFTELTPDAHFLSLRKHLAWYCKGFDGAAETRAKLLQVHNVQDVETIIRQSASQRISSPYSNLTASLT